MLNLNSKRAGERAQVAAPPDSMQQSHHQDEHKLAEGGHKRARTDTNKQHMQRMEYAQPPILASMQEAARSAAAAAAATAAASSQQQHYSPHSHITVAPFHSSPLTGAAIHSPRRAIVCASLEHAALCSSLLTQSSIHPAILQSLSVRLQALNDKDAEVVLARLTTLAKHLEEQTQAQKAARAAQIKHVQAQTLHSPQTNQQRNNTHACTTSPPHSMNSSASSGFPPPSPMPALSSSSSVSTDSTSRTTSPTISPAVGAMSPPQHASSSPQHFALQQGGGTQKQQISAAPRTPPQTASTHPPLHPGSGSGGSGSGSHYPQQLLLHSNGPARTQQHPHQPPLHPQQPQQQAQLLQQSHAHAHSPLPLTTSMAPSSTSTSSAASSSMHSAHAVPASAAALPQLDSSVAPPLNRSHSEDSDIPLGLMLLIEALPGSNVGPLTSAGDLANTTSPKVAQRSLRQTPEMNTATAGSSSALTASNSKGSAATAATAAASAAATNNALSAAALSAAGAPMLPPPTTRKRSSSF